MDALKMAKEAMEWSEEESLNTDAAPWYFAKAQAQAAIAQAEALYHIMLDINSMNLKMDRLVEALHGTSVDDGQIRSVGDLLARTDWTLSGQ